VFKNQARGTEDKKEKEFVNDLLRSDFHKRFMVCPIPNITKVMCLLVPEPLCSLSLSAEFA